MQITRHVQDDVDAPRDWAHDVADDEVDACLRKGRVCKAATYNQEYGEWTYQVEFQYDTHQLVTVTAIFSANNVLRVITRFRRKTQYDSRKPRSPKK